MTLPNGIYTGRAHVSLNVIEDRHDPDYGRTKLVFELTVTEGECKDAFVCVNRTVDPRRFDNEPALNDARAFERRRDEILNYSERTNQILGKCGVDISQTNETRLVESIGESNYRQPVVSFAVRDGEPQILRFIKFENSESYLAEDFRLPSGDDLPI